MNQIKSRLFLLFFVALFLFSICCSSNNGSPIKIQSAKRYQKLLLGSAMNPQELSATNPETDIVLDLRIKGISVEEFQASGKEEGKIYVMAGERQCIPNIKVSGEIGGRTIIRICVIVPKDVMELTLFVGSYPEKTFKVEKKIKDELSDWE